MDSYQNLATFNHLLQICSDRYMSLEKEESESSSGSETKKSKKLSAFDFTRTEDIRNLNVRNLVDRYSESTFDEMQRRYSFKCVFLPDECDKVSKSYGSEKKAYDEMKQHLLEHKSDLEIRIANGVWPPKRKIEYSDDSDVSSLSDSNERASKKLKTEHPSGIKMPKQNGNRRTKRQPRKKGEDSSLGKRKSPKEVASSSGLKTNSLSKSVNCSKENNKPTLKPTNQQGFAVDTLEDNKKEAAIVEEVVQDCTKEMCSPLCCHLNCPRAQPSTSQISPPIETSSKEDGIENEAIAKISLLYEHNYASLDGVKVEKINHPPVKNAVFRKRGCFIPPQLIIKTPPFPFVHVPLLPDCSSVEEIGLESTYDQMKTEVTDSSVATLEPSSPPNTETKAFSLKGKRLPRKPKKTKVSSSVLECVENRVDVVASSVHVPNDISSSDDNVENSENIQKVERDLGLKYIAMLRSKKNRPLHGPLICKICNDKLYTAQATLVNHYRSHAGIKPFTCNVCENTFTRQHSLKYHYMIHRGQSRFTCEYCKRQFRHPSHFKEHLRRHTGETPFGCPNCSLKFKTRNTYKRHLKMQHNKILVSQNTSDYSD